MIEDRSDHGDAGISRDGGDPLPHSAAATEDQPDTEKPASDGATPDQPRDVAFRIEEIPAADGADVLEGLPADTAADVAEYLDPETAGRILSEMDPRMAATVLGDMEAAEASMVVSAMAPDDRVDVLEHVPDEQHDAILGEMDAEDARDIRELEKYPPDTAGGIMTTEVTSLREDLTIEQAIVELRRLSQELEQMWYVYVIDRRNHLVGVLSIRDLILGRPEKRLQQIMRRQVSTVLATLDQEEVARLFRRYNYLAMPVVDARHRLVGLITFDDAADVIEEEATEDMHKLFGAGARERIASRWPFSLSRRIGWLEVRLLLGFAAAMIVTQFSRSVAALPTLAALLIVVSGIGATGGSQALAVAVRGIASGEVERKSLYRLLYREAVVGLLSGVVVGLTAACFAATGLLDSHHFHIRHAYTLAAVLALALMVNQVFACLIGVGIPLALKRLGLDPAQSGIIWTTSATDCFAMLTILGLASVCIRWIS